MAFPAGFRVPIAVLALALCAACARDSEADLRSQLDRWFYLGRTGYFTSQMRCTAAMIHVVANQPRERLAVQDHPERARNALRQDGVAAIRVAALSPNDVTDYLLLDDTGYFGKQAYAAGALASACLKDRKIKGLLHEALTRKGAMLAYDSVNEGLMILDPVRYILFYLAGDVW